MTDEELLARGLEPIDWPYMIHNLECPLCQSSWEVPTRAWVSCPNLACEGQLFVLVAGLLRRKKESV